MYISWKILYLKSMLKQYLNKYIVWKIRPYVKGVWTISSIWLFWCTIKINYACFSNVYAQLCCVLIPILKGLIKYIFHGLKSFITCSMHENIIFPCFHLCVNMRISCRTKCPWSKNQNKTKSVCQNIWRKNCKMQIKLRTFCCWGQNSHIVAWYYILSIFVTWSGKNHLYYYFVTWWSNFYCETKLNIYTIENLQSLVYAF